jgi:phosphoglycolate phosphatase-like HAD superfamily hydrolase
MGLGDILDLEAGAYGDDHYQRSRLPALAAERAARRYGQAFKAADVVVVGDTPHDVECGQAFGARTVAVASGAYTLEALRAHTPDALLPALEPLEAALAAILD